MERLAERLLMAQTALKTLQEALSIAEPSSLERDGTLQRFEYALETVWKAAQNFLYQVHGTEASSPKSCMRELGRVGILSVEQTHHALEMVDDRNLTSHTYNDNLAQQIYRRLPKHCQLLQTILSGVELPRS